VSDLGEFLKARRAQVLPLSTPAGPRRRRVAGLRRDELAALAGISEPYLVRLEQGRDRNPSPQVLVALARALRLDGDGLAHLHRLASPGVPGSEPEVLAPGIASLLDAWGSIPAYVRGRRFDVLASNALARALVPAHTPGRNLVRDVFLEPTMRTFYADWPAVAHSTVSAVRAATVDDPVLLELAASLARESPEFRELWERHDVRPTRDEVKQFRHPALGEFTLLRHVLRLDGGQVIIAYQPRPGDAATAALLGRLA